MEALTARVPRGADGAPTLKADLPRGRRAPHFSFGASVQEHLPGEVARDAPPASTALLLDAPRQRRDRRWPPCAGSVSAAASSWRRVCHRVFASARRASRPAGDRARRVRAHRVGRARRRASAAAHAEDLCLTRPHRHGRRGARDGPRRRTAPTDPAEAALDWARAHLLPTIGVEPALRGRAPSRADLRARFAAELPRDRSGSISTS